MVKVSDSINSFDNKLTVSFLDVLYNYTAYQNNSHILKHLTQGHQGNH